MTIEIGQRWNVKKHPRAVWTTDESVHVMAVVEGYVVARFADGYPLVYTEKQFRKDYELRATACMPAESREVAMTQDPLANDQCVQACRCDCGYTCGGPGRCELFATDAAACIDQHFKRDCEHVFKGWKEGRSPGGGSYGTTVCEKCGLTAIGHDEMVGP